MRSRPRAARTILLFHVISARPSKQPRMVRTFLNGTLGINFEKVDGFRVYLQKTRLCSVCVFITAGPSTKLFAWGGRGYLRTCATRDDDRGLCAAGWHSSAS